MLCYVLFIERVFLLYMYMHDCDVILILGSSFTLTFFFFLPYHRETFAALYECYTNYPQKVSLALSFLLLI